jgi:hypothetical protein
MVVTKPEDQEQSQVAEKPVEDSECEAGTPASLALVVCIGIPYYILTKITPLPPTDSWEPWVPQPKETETRSPGSPDSVLV